MGWMNSKKRTATKVKYMHIYIHITAIEYRRFIVKAHKYPCHLFFFLKSVVGIQY